MSAEADVTSDTRRPDRRIRMALSLLLLLGLIYSVELVAPATDLRLMSHDADTETKSGATDPTNNKQLSVRWSLEKDEILERLGIQLGPFPNWNASGPLPCFPLEDEWNTGTVQRSPARRGFLFVKIPKTGSSTGGSVTLRLAASAGRLRNISLCRNRVQHSHTYEMGYDGRRRAHSLLWSLVREPTARAVSQFFHFHVARRNRSATDDVFRRFLADRLDEMANFQLRYLSLRRRFDDPARLIEELFREYNLIGVTERFDETVVVLQMLLGLRASDVMYLSAKGSGGYDDGRYKNKCFYIPKSFVSPGMQEYFESDEWQNITYWDKVLHRAANYALDLRIEQLGRVQFERNLAQFLALKQQVEAVCGPTVKLPCTTTGVKLERYETDCLYDDMGCGHDCIDAVDRTTE